MNKNALLLWICTGVLICVSFSCRKESNQFMYHQADSLNQLAYRLHYINLNRSSEIADEAYNLSTGFPALHAEAMNNKGFCTFIRMDFDKAEEQFKSVYNITTNELERLIADIGLMKIYQRISMNKEFYDYRNTAIQRMKRIQEDSLSITDPEEWKRFNYAKTEFAITSGIYYYYLQQESQSLDEINRIEEDNVLKSDTAQLLYYYYMRGSGGMYEADTPQDVVLGEFNYLMECYEIAHEHGYIYFEANSLQALAEMLMEEKNYALLMERRPNLMRLLNTKDFPWDELILSMANEALQLFKQYGDMYQISGSYRTIASCCNALGKYDEALDYLTKALEYVNKHHEMYYHCNDSTDRLYTYIPNASTAIELNWNSRGIKTVHEWITRLREQLSVTYAALGMKQESDYNRNIYLDLLDYTRQDKELESRYMALQKESSQLNILMIAVAVGVITLILLFLLLNRRWRIRNTAYIEKLKSTLAICQRITAAIPTDAEDISAVTDAIQHAVKDDILNLVDGKELTIHVHGPEGRKQETEAPYLCHEFLLTSSENNKPLGEVVLYTTSNLKKDDKALMRIITPYIAWTIENGLTFITLSDEQKMLEKEQYVHQQHLIENKRQNIIKKACLFIVTGITPYIDRINNEIHKLIALDYIHNQQIKQEKYTYIHELVTSINEYNDILALWIKMRQGTLNLHIENFEINSLFDIVSKSRKTFEMKRQQLRIIPTQAIAKADKALTLFMINTLMDNARKYTPAGGKIEVYATENNEYVEISIKDDGAGLSEEDIHCILSEKVYDSKKIGIQTSSDTTEIKNNKGYGFGLMNCKGIIEKYRKTNTIFQVCTFNIESRLGKGSRFYFRLPKGIQKSITVWAAVLLSFFTSSCNDYIPLPEQSTNPADSIQFYDPLLHQADKYAYQAFDCNVEGDYEAAIDNADFALFYLNEHYKKYSGNSTPLATLAGEEQTAELIWYSNHFITDYHILLQIRNEAAVAYLALNDFEAYRYNNAAYTALYKQISKDTSLEFYCQHMQMSANNKTIAIVICLALLIAFFIGYYVLYFHHRLTYRYDLQQVLEINKQVFQIPSSSNKQEGEENKIVELLVKAMTEGINELVTYERLGLMVVNEESNVSYTAFSPHKPTDPEMPDEMQEIMNRCYQQKTAHWAEGNKLKCLPLWVEAGGENHCIGVLALQYTYENERADDRLMVKLVASYVAIIAYNAIVLMTRKYQDIESAQDEANRAIHEENQLHVQNLVLDNCLSTIKHETIYYPNKIKQIIDKLQNRPIIEEEKKEIETVSDLIGYYKDIFTILSSCAAKQLEEVTFRRETLNTTKLAEYASNYFKRKTRKQNVCITLHTEAEEVLLSGDDVELKYLLENLINEAIAYTEKGELQLRIYKEGPFVRFDFTDTRRQKTQEELNLLFNPHLSRIHQEDEGVLTGTEYLICKQIIREHDEYTGRRGCRINAQEAQPQGFTVWFTIPVAINRN